LFANHREGCSKTGFSAEVYKISAPAADKQPGSTRYVKRKGSKECEANEPDQSERFPSGQHSGLPSNCHQRTQIDANADKRTQQTEAAILLISLGKVRERFPAFGEISITNRLLYH